MVSSRMVSTISQRSFKEFAELLCHVPPSSRSAIPITPIPPSTSTHDDIHATHYIPQKYQSHFRRTPQQSQQQQQLESTISSPSNPDNRNTTNKQTKHHGRLIKRIRHMLNDLDLPVRDIVITNRVNVYGPYEGVDKELLSHVAKSVGKRVGKRVEFKRDWGEHVKRVWDIVEREVGAC
ncbi:uncharacterized protein SPPG_06578 [Spizellomyces punctatus DAOM BR117]|uniref:Uncharacterized protein n=1 Tax=Spizellomyces punctatus (strain DAOM BR117) TaxID=645134 RepID=A0A0L0HBE0_SPIPD|nr:uncharacterized protein SPPG_06578 [Spizellomyces punctatus DAOM BR117]KNC98174.1 hypothetical protein SPPG_06578 [Spizellomyces punctatus DAOM BR117]|eukprot:XP_016606214.1 hypothetical protein SPPG_06578 [Spizellomyces punctatus DAOM BR117]